MIDNTSSDWNLFKPGLLDAMSKLSHGTTALPACSPSQDLRQHHIFTRMLSKCPGFDFPPDGVFLRAYPHWTRLVLDFVYTQFTSVEGSTPPSFSHAKKHQ